MSQKVLRNKAKCKKCGQEIESGFHDAVSCLCASIMVSGTGSNAQQFGSPDVLEDRSDYLRMVVNNPDPYRPSFDFPPESA